jgi:hypothetical protein
LFRHRPAEFTDTEGGLKRVQFPIC